MTGGVVNLRLLDDKLPVGNWAQRRVRVEEKHRLMSVVAAVDEREESAIVIVMDLILLC